MDGVLTGLFQCKGFPITAKEVSKTRDSQNKMMLEDIQLIKRELAAARSRFNFETDFELVEASIYQIAALEVRYNHLIKLAKQAQVA